MLKKITRRSLLKKSALATAAGALYLNFPYPLFGEGSGTKTPVVLIRDENVMDKTRKFNPGVMKEMLNQAIIRLTNTKNAGEAWKKLIHPDDVVGIKSNVWSYLPTPKELEMAIKEGVMSAGVPEERLSIRDRGLLDDPIFTDGTALINVRPMRTHDWSGVGSLIKNYITFVRKPSDYHPDTCADLATLWKLPFVEGKTRLNILVMITPLFNGVGPHHYNKKYTWEYKGLLVGFDPVAVDSVGIQILQQKRREYFEEDRPIKPPVKHIFLADTRHNLGTADPGKIDLIKLGWDKDILV